MSADNHFQVTYYLKSIYITLTNQIPPFITVHGFHVSQIWHWNRS